MDLDVFVCYSVKDKTVADAVVSTLEEKKLRCWYAPRDIVPGADWAGSIVGAINDCRIMVLLFSDFANESEQVLREVGFAMNAGKTVIPFRLTEKSPSGTLGYYLKPLHWLDAMNDELKDSIEKLYALCEGILKVIEGSEQEAGKNAVPVKNEPALTGEPGRKKKKKKSPAFLVLAGAVTGIVLFILLLLLFAGDDSGTQEDPVGAQDIIRLEDAWADDGIYGVTIADYMDRFVEKADEVSPECVHSWVYENSNYFLCEDGVNCGISMEFYTPDGELNPPEEFFSVAAVTDGHTEEIIDKEKIRPYFIANVLTAYDECTLERATEIVDELMIYASRNVTAYVGDFGEIYYHKTEGERFLTVDDQYRFSGEAH